MLRAQGREFRVLDLGVRALDSGVRFQSFVLDCKPKVSLSLNLNL